MEVIAGLRAALKDTSELDYAEAYYLAHLQGIADGTAYGGMPVAVA